MLRRKDLTLIYICDIIFFQKKIYIKSYIKIYKICYFWRLNINLRENCVVLGTAEDSIVLRTQFHSRICKKFEIFLIKGKFFWPVKKKYDRESLQFSKFQHIITGKLFNLGKIWRQHSVQDTFPLQDMYKFRVCFEKSHFLLASVIIYILETFVRSYYYSIHSFENITFYKPHFAFFLSSHQKAWIMQILKTWLFFK